MSNHHSCLALFGLGVFLSAAATGCPVNDAAFEPLAAAPEVCASDADCDDGNVCTTNSCDDQTFVCIVSSLDGVPASMAPQDECVEHVCKMGVDTTVFVAAGTAAATQVAGDCKKMECDGKGGKVEVNDDEDAKLDGLDCTIDVCTNGVPANNNAPVDTPCGQGLDLKCNGKGQCGGCTTDAECSAGNTPCASAACSAQGLCDVMFKPNGTPLPAQDQTAEDCKVRVCDGAGNTIDIADPNDPKNDGNECTADMCNGATPANSPKQVGAACNGTSTCDGAGHCLGVLADPCTANNECSSGHCVDGVCCETTCPDLCKACNVSGSAGTCGNIPFPGTDAMCSGTKVCDGTGQCDLANGQSCNPGHPCASGTCSSGKCKSTTGQPCVMNADCVSAMCVNGVCT